MLTLHAETEDLDPWAAGMLAFDLETEDLDPRTAGITCAAVCDPSIGLERVFYFHRDPGTKQYSTESREAGEEFMRLLDEAPRLCAFNGARFDLPFVHHQLGASEQRVAAWRLKLHDVHESCRLALGVTFGLDELLALNGMPGKTGSGADAIVMAREGMWERLGEYCLNDTRRTHAVSSLRGIRIPKTRGLLMRRDGSFVVSDLS